MCSFSPHSVILRFSLSSIRSLLPVKNWPGLTGFCEAHRRFAREMTGHILYIIDFNNRCGVIKSYVWLVCFNNNSWNSLFNQDIIEQKCPLEKPVQGGLMVKVENRNRKADTAAKAVSSLQQPYPFHFPVPVFLHNRFCRSHSTPV